MEPRPCGGGFPGSGVGKRRVVARKKERAIRFNACGEQLARGKEGHVLPIGDFALAHGVMPGGNGGAVRAEADGVYAARCDHADGGFCLRKAEAAVGSFGGCRGLSRPDVDGLIDVVAAAAADHGKRGQQRQQQSDPLFRIHCNPPKNHAYKRGAEKRRTITQTYHTIKRLRGANAPTGFYRLFIKNVALYRKEACLRADFFHIQTY